MIITAKVKQDKPFSTLTNGNISFSANQRKEMSMKSNACHPHIEYLKYCNLVTPVSAFPLSFPSIYSCVILLALWRLATSTGNEDGEQSIMSFRHENIYVRQSYFKSIRMFVSINISIYFPFAAILHFNYRQRHGINGFISLRMWFHLQSNVLVCVSVCVYEHAMLFSYGCAARYLAPTQRAVDTANAKLWLKGYFDLRNVCEKWNETVRVSESECSCFRFRCQRWWCVCVRFMRSSNWRRPSTCIGISAAHRRTNLYKMRNTCTQVSSPSMESIYLLLFILCTEQLP